MDKPNSNSKFKELLEKQGITTTVPDYDAKLWNNEFQNVYHVEEINGKLKISQTKGNEPFNYLTEDDLQKIKDETEKAVAPRNDSQGNPIKLSDIKQKSRFPSK